MAAQSSAIVSFGGFQNSVVSGWLAQKIIVAIVLPLVAVARSTPSVGSRTCGSRESRRPK